MTAKKISRSEHIPNIGSMERLVLLPMVPELPKYLDLIGSGWRLYTKEELSALEEKYSDGMTWEEISSELMRFGIEYKKPTFRKHIQDELLPGAIGYKLVGKKRMAIFPKDVIAHINFNRYFLKAEDPREYFRDLAGVIEEVEGKTITTAICMKSDYFDLFKGFYGSFRNDLAREGIYTGADYSRGDDENVRFGRLEDYRNLFRDILKNDNALMNKALRYIDEIELLWQPVNSKIIEFCDFVENTPISTETLTKLLDEERKRR